MAPVISPCSLTSLKKKNKLILKEGSQESTLFFLHLKQMRVELSLDCYFV